MIGLKIDNLSFLVCVYTIKPFSRFLFVAAATFCLMAGAAPAVAATCPCDILSSGGAPCVAAFSTTRALLASYNGPLYQLRRASDGQLKDVAPITPGGIANAATQDSFCTGTTCTISEIYDQSGKANHLKRSQGGGQVCMHQDQEAVADALPFMLGGHKVYGIKVVSDNNGGCTPPAGGEGTGYRLDKTTGIATGDQAETEYMVTSGTYQPTRTAAVATTSAMSKPMTWTTARRPWKPFTSEAAPAGAMAAGPDRGSWPTWKTAYFRDRHPATPATRPCRTLM